MALYHRTPPGDSSQAKYNASRKEEIPPILPPQPDNIAGNLTGNNKIQDVGKNLWEGEAFAEQRALKRQVGASPVPTPGSEFDEYGGMFAQPLAQTGEIKVKRAQSVMINGGTYVTTPDIKATNGIIHVIDKVLLPPTVVDFANSNPAFSILVEAVVKADLVDALSAQGPYTVFAPTNDAFEALFAQLGVSGIADLSAEALTPILLYHVLGDNVISSEVAAGSVATLNPDAMLNIDIMNSSVILNENTTVVAVDVQASNGVIHVIDKVLLP